MYRVVVLELMYQMIRETHGLQRRCLTLTGHNGRCLRKLLTASVSLTPTLSKLVWRYKNYHELWLRGVLLLIANVPVET